jgi:hypothetical protein
VDRPAASPGAGGAGSYIRYSGDLWQNLYPCTSGGTYVYLSWDSPTHHNVKAGGPAYRNQNINVFYYTGTTLSPAHIKVTVCSQYGGWHCGSPVGV